MSKEFEDAANTIPDDERLSPEQAQAEYDLADEEAEGGMDVKKLVGSQYKLIRGLQQHLFEPSGKPKTGTKYADIKSFVGSSMQLLEMLRKFQNALNTDEDFKRVELALEMTFEEVQCPEFALTFKNHLTTLTENTNETV